MKRSEPERSSKLRWITVTLALGLAASAAMWSGVRPTDARSMELVVYKTPTCGCCGDWVAHLREHGFDVNTIDVSNTQPARDEYGVPRRLASCHTAKIGDYWVEGHVPADLIERLVTEQPENIRGIAVPGMPIGAPGMEGPNPVIYDVLAYDIDGRISVFATREGRRSPQ